MIRLGLRGIGARFRHSRNREWRSESAVHAEHPSVRHAGRHGITEARFEPFEAEVSVRGVIGLLHVRPRAESRAPARRRRHPAAIAPLRLVGCDPRPTRAARADRRRRSTHGLVGGGLRRPDRESTLARPLSWMTAVRGAMPGREGGVRRIESAYPLTDHRRLAWHRPLPAGRHNALPTVMDSDREMPALPTPRGSPARSRLGESPRPAEPRSWRR